MFLTKIKKWDQEREMQRRQQNEVVTMEVGTEMWKLPAQKGVGVGEAGSEDLVWTSRFSPQCPERMWPALLSY